MVDATTIAQGLTSPPKGAFIRPRSIEVGQSPERILAKNPRRIGAYVFNNGGTLEIPLVLPTSGASLAAAAFLDSAIVPIPTGATSSYKTLLLYFDIQLTWVTAGQPKLQFVASRLPLGPISGAVSQVTGPALTRSTPVNIGPAAATALGPGAVGFSAVDIGDLQWHWPFVGAELQFPSALTAGSARLYLEMPGSPALFLSDNPQISAAVGDRSSAWSLAAQAGPMLIPGSAELWAVAGLGGTIDCRVWEIWQ